MSEVPQAGAGPPAIADLSYRNYAGPLRPLRLRWWVITRMGVRQAFRRKGFWVLALFSLFPYLSRGFLFYLRSQMPEGLASFLSQRSFAGHFYDAFGDSLFWTFLAALLVGAGSIAGDNRANALQIYLSKPIGKGDYLAGKWLGIFLPLAFTSAVPALVLFLYCWGSFADEGFIRDNPGLWLQALGGSLLPPTLHASLILGFSAFFKRPLLAGGVCAAFQVGLQALTGIAFLVMNRTGNVSSASTVLHCSIDGVFRGLGRYIYGEEPSFFGMAMRRGQDLPAPDFVPLLAIGVGVILLGVAAARFRVRAVEVVRG